VQVLPKDINLIQTILESLPNGVLVIDAGGCLALINPAARQLLHLEQDRAIGNGLESYVEDDGLREMVLSLARHSPEKQSSQPVITYKFSTDNNRLLMATGRPPAGQPWRYGADHRRMW
jgi:two-component system phosphate regulon sensor histidine kinase PhoR